MASLGGWTPENWWILGIVLLSVGWMKDSQKDCLIVFKNRWEQREDGVKRLCVGDIVTANMSLIALKDVMWDDYQDDDIDDRDTLCGQ